MREGSLVTPKIDFPAFTKLYISPNPPKKAGIYTVQSVEEGTNPETGKSSPSLILVECPVEPTDLAKSHGCEKVMWPADQFDEIQPPMEVDISKLMEEPITA